MNRAEFESLFNGYFKATTVAMLTTAMPSPRTYELSRSMKVMDTDKGFSVEWETEYLPYTVERWISPRWRGRENPNLQWIKKRGIEPRLDLFVARFGGRWYER